MHELIDATKDYLTHCYTRESLNPFLGKMEADYRLNHIPFSVLIIDVDHFKFFNDKYGHLCGDEVLKYFSSSIRLDLESEMNMPFRFGGDEFIVVFPGKTARETRRLAERLKKNIKMRPCLYKGKNIKMGFSGGITCYPGDANSVEELLERADEALYYSKNSGRGRIVVYETMKVRALVVRMTLVVLLFASIYLYTVTKDPLPRFVSEAWARISSISFRSPFHIPPKRPEVTSQVQTAKPAGGQNVFNFLRAYVPSPPTPAPDPTPVYDVIHLRSGRQVQGKILSENDDEVRLEVKFNEGKGSLGIRKADILDIERDVAG